jgi:hypothetical protein
MFPEHTPIAIDVMDIPSIKDSLDREGYAVVHVPSVDTGEVQRLFATDLTEITGPICTDIWGTSLKIPNSSIPGLMGEYGLSQGNAAWSVRSNQQIINLHKKLLDAEDVVCSMDAIGYTHDCMYFGGGGHKCLHIDQSPSSSVNSIQGIFYAEDSYGDRAGTAVVPGSHRDSHPFNQSNYSLVDQYQYAPKAVKLALRAGSLLLFNSKLVHQGVLGPHRLCFMICYRNKEDRAEEARKRKIVMYLGGHRSNHMSQLGIYHGWKWQHGEHWNMLVPRTNTEYPDQLDMIDDEVTDPESYSEEMDGVIPSERLALL